MTEIDEIKTRAGFVAIIGPTNAGKSTLLNRLIGQKISIVTHKVQTTRAMIRGIAVYDKTQIVFVDTPGIFRARHLLEKAMIQNAWEGAEEADQVLLVMDARRGKDEAIERILEGLEGKAKNVTLALNKVDTVKKPDLLKLAEEMNQAFPFADTVMISAQNGSGVMQLQRLLSKKMPISPFLYPEDQISDSPMRQIAAELTREKIFLRLHQEIPYSTTVETEKWEDKRNGIRIEQTVYVTRENHRRIILGHKGENIRKIGQEARKELGEMMGCEIHLFLFVKVRENWQNDPERYTQMGLEIPKSQK